MDEETRISQIIWSFPSNTAGKVEKTVSGKDSHGPYVLIPDLLLHVVPTSSSLPVWLSFLFIA